MASIALRAMTSKPWVLSVGRHSSPAHGASPLAFEWEASDMNAPRVAACGPSPAIGGDAQQPVRDILVVYTQGVAVGDDRTTGDGGRILPLGGPNLQSQRERAGQGGTGIRATYPANLFVGRENEVDVVGGSLPAVAQQASRAQQRGHRGAVVKEVGPDIVSEFHQVPLAAVDAYPAAGVHARRVKLVGATAGEDINVLPIQRLIALIGFGLPDPRALNGGVFGAKREHRSHRLPVAEHRDRAKPEIAGIHHPELSHVQGAIGFDPLDQHGQFIHVRHDPRRIARSSG